jgi:hypothetical protein
VAGICVAGMSGAADPISRQHWVRPIKQRGALLLSDIALRERIGAIYLVVGRGRQFEGHHWPLIVGVHAAGLPEMRIDEESL